VQCSDSVELYSKYTTAVAAAVSVGNAPFALGWPAVLSSLELKGDISQVALEGQGSVPPYSHALRACTSLSFCDIISTIAAFLHGCSHAVHEWSAAVAHCALTLW
jgi:hypothetical protein